MLWFLDRHDENSHWTTFETLDDEIYIERRNHEKKTC